MAIAQLNSSIDHVKVYCAGATITRIAQLSTPGGQLPEQVEIAGLPLALEDSSVRVRVEAETGVGAIATDIRIGLAVPPHPRPQASPSREELQHAETQVQQLEHLLAQIEQEICVLYHLTIPERPEAELGIAPPPSPLATRLALTNFKDEQIRNRLREKQETTEKLRQAQKYLEDQQQQHAQASSAQQVQPYELRKTAIITLTPQATVPTLTQHRIYLEYFVPGARWTPAYICQLNSHTNTANLAIRAFLCQRTGEDWTGVKLELSTAEPTRWCELPELPSLRLGRTQVQPKKSGWRLPPVGAETLFEDYDHYKTLTEQQPTSDQLPQLQGIRVPRLPDFSLITEFVQFREDAPSAGTSDSLPQGYGKGSLGFDFSGVEDEEFGELESLLEDSRAVRSASPQVARRDVTMSAAPALPRSPINQQRKALALTQAESQAYQLMQMATPDNARNRGKLKVTQPHERYLEILQRQNIIISINIITVVQEAVNLAQSCLSLPLPPGGINVRLVAGSFDYSYQADGRVDVPSDGQFHTVALTNSTTDVSLRYVVVPRIDTNVFRIAQLQNPLAAPLLAGSADVYVNGEYILSTPIETVPPRGQMELGLGVEQGIKVARNTHYQEVRSGQTLVAFSELRHQIKIDIANRLPQNARIEVRERLPIPEEGAKVDVKINAVEPNWQPYTQEERNAVIKGGYRWNIEVPAKSQQTLTVNYTVKTFINNEVVGGNRRE